VAIIVFALIAWQISGVGMGVATLVSLIAIGAIGAWSQAMVTLTLVLTALLFCIVIGLPLGIWLARSPRAAKIIRPLLDAMQTTPAFVYLVPIVMLFGIGNVPGRPYSCEPQWPLWLFFPSDDGDRRENSRHQYSEQAAKHPLLG
ncbi:ABC transporter permease subunit, partial [Klebsiella pneumoniae]|uniref:ABC transporter permease subunit n=1 Tax=Klebsiella pneumoniae TaxID=573 RepID=UPI00385792F6